MCCDRSSSTCSHWNLRRIAGCWKLLHRHRPSTSFTTAFLTLEGLTCCSTTGLARDPRVGWKARSSGCCTTFKYFAFPPNGIQSSTRFFLWLYNFNLVWRAVCAKKSPVGGWCGYSSAASGVVFYAWLVLNGAHMQRWALGVWCFDTDGLLRSSRKMSKED